jgi:hypothetical protein
MDRSLLRVFPSEIRTTICDERGESSKRSAGGTNDRGETVADEVSRREGSCLDNVTRGRYGPTGTSRTAAYAAAKPADDRLSRASLALAAITATANICSSVNPRCTTSSVSNLVEKIVWPVHAHQIRMKAA